MLLRAEWGHRAKLAYNATPMTGFGTPLRVAAVVLVVALAAAAAVADSAMLPTAMVATRLTELLERSGFDDLSTDEHRVIRELHGQYVEAYATIRDARSERWLAEVDALLSLARAPNERDVRQLLREHAALCERAAALDRELFDGVEAALPSVRADGSAADLGRARGLREVDRLAATIPRDAPIGVRGDPAIALRHVHVPPTARDAVHAILAERDRALPARARAVVQAWRDLIIAASRAFEEETGGILSAVGAALSAEEEDRLRERIVERCRPESERCAAARARVREADDAAIAAIAERLAPNDRTEFALRLAMDRGTSDGGIPQSLSASVATEAAFRGALRHFGTEDPARAGIDAAYARWTAALDGALAHRRTAGDAREDLAILEFSSFDGEWAELAEILEEAGMDADAVGGAGLPARVRSSPRSAARAAMAELAAILVPHAGRLDGSRLVLRDEQVAGSSGEIAARPWVTSLDWLEAIGSPTGAPSAATARAIAARSPTILAQGPVGVLPWCDGAWLESAVLTHLPPERKNSARALAAEFARRHADRVDRPREEAKERVRASISARDGEYDGAVASALATRDRAFFANEQNDREFFEAIGESCPEPSAKAAVERAALERALDRELACFELLALSTANPLTAVRLAPVAPETRERLYREAVSAMRWFLPDLRRSRAASFALAAHRDRSSRTTGGVDALLEGPGQQLFKASYDADRQSERSFKRLLATLAEAAAPERDAFEATYARLAAGPSLHPPRREGDSAGPRPRQVDAMLSLIVSHDAGGVAAPAVGEQLGKGAGPGPGSGAGGARRAEVDGLCRAHAEERDRLAVERAKVECGLRSPRSRIDEMDRLTRAIAECDDRLVAALLGLLTADERRLLLDTDSLDRALDGPIVDPRARGSPDSACSARPLPPLAHSSDPRPRMRGGQRQSAIHSLKKASISSLWASPRVIPAISVMRLASRGRETARPPPASAISAKYSTSPGAISRRHGLSGSFGRRFLNHSCGPDGASTGSGTSDGGAPSGRTRGLVGSISGSSSGIGGGSGDARGRSGACGAMA